MKKTILTLLLIFGINSIYANCFLCASSGMEFFPKQKQIGLNPMFIIEGYAMSQKTINGFKHRKIYLETKNGELIELNLQKILKGQMSLTQAIFKPSKQLEPNSIYFLKYSNQTEKEGKEMTQYNRESKKIEKVYWETTKKNVKTSEKYNNLDISFIRSNVTHFGCGPAVSAIFKIKNMKTFDFWYKAEVIEISSNTKTTYYIKSRNSKLSIGHGMCSGAFTFNQKSKYKVKFTLINTEGKPLKTTNWKRFDSPYTKDNSRF
ncbi:hypothetical protein [uncultured Tenacibaculum sp.]|uniref:hypothetical protein n=1 Tax=uncultured Tenacibaculum sp. TaxID=174713 RepID=UPI00261F8481|nr:hypothetical protein [uncultured Tenacibaculum sp.]